MTKFGAVKTVVDGITFASKKEARRYGELKMFERAGQISHLELQPRFPLRVNGHLVCTYVGDFAYFDLKASKRVIEDSKGFKTREYITKRKLLLALNPGIDHREV